MMSLIGIFRKDFFRAITSDHVLDNATVAVTELLTRFRGILLLPLIIKKFGFADYGIWVLCGSLSGMLSVFAGFSLHTYLVRHVAEEEDPVKRGEIYISVLILLIAVNFVLMLLLAGLFQIFDAGQLMLGDSGATKYMSVAFLAIPFMALQIHNLNFLRAIQRIRLQGILSLTMSGLELLFILLSLMLGGLIHAFWAIFIWRSTASLIMAGVIILRNGWSRPRFVYMKEAWRFSTPLIFSNLSTLALAHGDKLLIGGFFGSVTLGLYAVGSNLGGVILCLIAPFNVTLLPKMSRIWGRDEHSARQMVEQYANYFLFAAIPVVAFTIFFGKDLLLLFGKEGATNLKTYLTLIFVSLANVFWGLSIFESYLLYGTKNTKAVASIRVVTAILYILLNYFLLKRFGFGIAGINLLLSHILLYAAYRKAGRSRMRLRGPHLLSCLFISSILCGFIMLFNLDMVRLWTMFPIGLSYLLSYCLIIYLGRIFFRKYVSERS
jgi:O-antigen/teichoic acid export membrane protein